ncbi:MAG: NAD+ synthase [Solirubrobacterales bacterium]|nr:NAD+ synthase [Solirubrobacterales bacterium]
MNTLGVSAIPVTALAQIDPVVGDLDGNAAVIADWTEKARLAGAELVIFPELCLTGYPAEDLYLRPDFIAANVAVLNELAREVGDITALVGYAEPVGSRVGRAIAANAVAVLGDREIRSTYRKRVLPNYGVFDEFRTFRNGSAPQVIPVGRHAVGLTVCEDCWGTESAVPADLAPGAELIANLSASPYHHGKGPEREEIFRRIAVAEARPVAMVNAVGGQDELIFDGGSVLLAADGSVLARAGQFTEDLVICDRGSEPAQPMEHADEVYAALLTGLRDYVQKNGFGHVGLGLSGGIDSALVAALAVDALGPERVSCVVMPSPHSAAETQEDAREMTRRLGVELIEIPIEQPMAAFHRLLGPDASGLAAENLQARIRGTLMMTLSNSRGWLVLTTANKSETSVGYSTLYGDMAGGLAPIKDVPKTMVYELCRHRNRIAPVIPESIISRPPSAELRPGQQDVDSLPPYDTLDRILRMYVEEDRGPTEITETGEDPELVAEVVALVDRAEYKRRQSPPGLRITTKGFGRDRRMPITNRYRPWHAPTGDRPAG